MLKMLFDDSVPKLYTVYLILLVEFGGKREDESLAPRRQWTISTPELVLCIASVGTFDFKYLESVTKCFSPGNICLIKLIEFTRRMKCT